MAQISKREFCLGAVLAGAAWAPNRPRAASYPDRPITLIIHSAAGGSIDVVNRLVSEKVAALLKQPIVLDFRPGAGAMLGATLVARAVPDGATIGFLGSSIVASQGLGKAMNFDVRDYVPLGQFLNNRNSMMVSAKTNIYSLTDLARHAKEAPGKLNFGSTGYGSAPHLGMELFMQATGTKLAHIPYQSGAVATQDLIAGRIDAYFDGTSIGAPFHKSGQVRLIAVTGTRRTPIIPDVPTFQEAGFSAAEYFSWGAWVAPPKFPADYAKTIGDAFLAACKDEDLRRRFEGLGVDLVDVGPADLGSLIKTELAKYQALAKVTNIKLD